jgi:hypothetical protein
MWKTIPEIFTFDNPRIIDLFRKKFDNNEIYGKYIQILLEEGG